MTLYILTKTPKQTVNCAMLEVPATKHDRDLFFQLLGPTSDVTDFFREETTVDRFAILLYAHGLESGPQSAVQKLYGDFRSCYQHGEAGNAKLAALFEEAMDKAVERKDGASIAGSVRQRRRYQQGRPIPPDTPLARLGQHPTRFGPAPVALRQWCETGHGQPAAHPLHPRRKHTRAGGSGREWCNRSKVTRQIAVFRFRGSFAYLRENARYSARQWGEPESMPMVVEIR